MKIDGHTHTHFCPHGSFDSTSLMIERAIEQGFTHYHITEHLPLPEDFLQQVIPSEERDAMALKLHQVEPYLKEMAALRSMYQDRIQIYYGFEVDYLPDYEGWIRDLLNEYGPQCDTGILSVHFLKSKDGYTCMDATPEITRSALIPYFGSPEAFQLAYYQTVLTGVKSDLGIYKPKRIGHLALCNKFQREIPYSHSGEIEAVVDEILGEMKQRDMMLDYNVAGIFKEYCGEEYIPQWILKKASDLGVKLMYGSDSHGILDVGRGYEVYSRNIGRC